MCIIIMSSNKDSNSKYVMVNIQIPILLHESGTYDSYPEHISVEYNPIESLPIIKNNRYELNLADYFPQKYENIEHENTETISIEKTREEPAISPLFDLLTTVNEKKYIEINNQNKSKIKKSNTTFRQKLSHQNKKEFTRKTWNYKCDVIPKETDAANSSDNL